VQPFVPQKIFIEKSVFNLPLTQKVLSEFSDTPWEEIDRYQDFKQPVPITPAKKILAIAEQRGEALKPFPKIKNAINLGDYVFNPISNCHLECTYCILQSYLKNNPMITLFANTEYFLNAIEREVKAQPKRTYRIGTGELSDSLALDRWTQLSHELVPFFAKLPNAFLEFKTKSDAIENLLSLDHGGHTVLSWSLMPEGMAEKEELKCASLQDRLSCAARVQAVGYPVGLHLDPLIYHEGWEKNYYELIQSLSQLLDPKRLAWVSMGSLRFDKTLKEVATQRFPHTKIFAEDFIAAPDGKRRYFKTIRIDMYRKIWQWLQEWSRDFPRYLCMEPPWMWAQVTGEAAPDPEEMEANLVARLHELSSHQVEAR